MGQPQPRALTGAVTCRISRSWNRRSPPQSAPPETRRRSKPCACPRSAQGLGVRTAQDTRRDEPEERRDKGPLIHGLRDRVTAAITARRDAFRDAALDQRLNTETVDVTLPVRESPAEIGRIHPISQVIDELTAIFADMGFSVAEGPDIETDDLNFTKLNIPEGHPARAMHDTFFFNPQPDGSRLLLRTHTSPVQIRTMLRQKPPIRVICPGRTYRVDSDQTHTPMFHQVEGLVIDKGSHLGHLKWILEEFCKAFFEVDQVKMRFRPSFFPFTEPSLEVDIQCRRDKGEIRFGEGEDWLEILGCGMVHPNVLRNCGLDPDEYQGFAWGLGIDRIAMLKYGMPDLRAFFEADVRWVSHYGFRPLDFPDARGRAEPVKFTSVLAARTSRHRRAARRPHRQAHHDRARGRERRGQGADARAVHHRARDRGEAASQRRPPARLHGRHRQRRSGAGRVRRAQCPHRHEGRVLAARQLHSGQEHHARRRHHPRGGEPRHAVVGSRVANLRRPRGHHRSAGRCAGRRELCEVGRARRSGDRDQPDAQPPRLHRRARHRARSRGRRHGQVQGSTVKPVAGRVPLPGVGDARFRHDAVALPRLRAAPGARRQERAFARVAAAAPQRDRLAADQRAGRHHQLHHLRPRPSAARVRRRQGAGQPDRAPRPPGREPAGARRQDLPARRDDVRDRRRERRRVARRHHGRRGDRLLRSDHRRADRVRRCGTRSTLRRPAASSASIRTRVTASSAASIRTSWCRDWSSRRRLVLDLCGGDAVRDHRRRQSATPKIA